MIYQVNTKTYPSYHNINRAENKSALLKNDYTDTISFRGLISDKNLRNIKIYEFDLDETLLKGTADEQQEVISLARTNNPDGSYIVYSSRRPLEYMTTLAGPGRDLPLPDFYAALDGSHIYEKKGNEMVEIKAWSEKLSLGKEGIIDLLDETEKELGGTFNNHILAPYEFFPSEHILEVMIKPGYMDKIRDSMEAKLKQAGIKAEIITTQYRSDDIIKHLVNNVTKRPEEYIDTIDAGMEMLGTNEHGGFDSIKISVSDKGKALDYIRKEVLKDKEIAFNKTFGVGDGENDASVAALTTKGLHFLVMGNAVPKLIDVIKKLGDGAKNLYYSSQEGAAAIIEAIKPEN